VAKDEIGFAEYITEFGKENSLCRIGSLEIVFVHRPIKY
jgi:hypothetical protein